MLSLRDLSAHAVDSGGRPVPLLSRVDLTVPAGAVTAVIGPSGSGKTTLGLAALGASRTGVSLTGEVWLEDHELLSLPEARRRSLRSGAAAHLPQHPETVLDPVRRVEGALRELAGLRGRGAGVTRAERDAAVEGALRLAGLPPCLVRRRLPHQLSGGQQQRAALASALVTGARLLVLDEPTSGLDPATVRVLADNLGTLTEAGAGVLLLSHDLALVRELAVSVTVLEQGHVVEQGPTAEVLGGGAHALTRALVAAETRAGRGRTGPEPTGGASAEGVSATALAVRRRTGPSPLAGPVTMAFPPGSRTALVGVSGAGKTTFGRALAGLTPATAGRVTHEGRALPRRAERRTAGQRKIVQYVHQNSADSFEAHRPLLGQLAAAGRLLRGLSAEEAEREAAETADRMGLDEPLLHRTPGTLSGGQLQRCALVRALTARPALLVCDEATSALDALARERVLTALPDLLAPAGTALLLITHDQTAVSELADTVAVFEAGRCVRHGPA
ncbi:ATP-binding cassette domain-containing protein [Streptomyces sp. ODS28]|uniref:ABC transporter ATP-binding protein n=1 Tax=Streptomyces sp. ODS28 TaxID=3136688 RepID=UPI0031F112E3